MASEQILLDEREAAHHQVLNLEQLLELNAGLVLLQLSLGYALSISVSKLLVGVSWRLLRILVELILLGLWLHFDEVRHEELVRDELEPCEGEGRVVVRVQLLQEVSQVEQDLALDLLVEALAHLSHGSEDVHQEPVVGLLVEDVLLGVVIGIELLPDELEDLGHELQLVDVKGGQQDKNQLRQAVDEAVVKRVVIEATLT